MMTKSGSVTIDRLHAEIVHPEADIISAIEAMPGDRYIDDEHVGAILKKSREGITVDGLSQILELAKRNAINNLEKDRFVEGLCWAKVTQVVNRNILIHKSHSAT